jgi:hypothetical protein
LDRRTSREERQRTNSMDRRGEDKTTNKRAEGGGTEGCGMHGPYRWTSGVESISAHTEDERLEREKEDSKANRILSLETSQQNGEDEKNNKGEERGEART